MLLLLLLDDSHRGSQQLNGESHSIPEDLFDGDDLLQLGHRLVRVALRYQAQRELLVGLRVVIYMADALVSQQSAAAGENLGQQDVDFDEGERAGVLWFGEVVPRDEQFGDQVQVGRQWCELTFVEVSLYHQVLQLSRPQNVQQQALQHAHTLFSEFGAGDLQNVKRLVSSCDSVANSSLSRFLS